MTVASQGKIGSLRAYHRLEKRSRIREAARAVFRSKGYKQATTREIAEKARVAHATLFRYASDKRELLLLIINDDLDAICLDPDKYSKGNIVESIVEFYSPRFFYFAQDPQISRPFVTESFNFMAADETEIGPEAQRNRARRVELITVLTELVDRQKAHLNGFSSALAAELVHAIYLSTARAWLETDQPDPKEGLQRLARLIEMAATGFVR